jgi:AraC family transcriptional regulator
MLKPPELARSSPVAIEVEAEATVQFAQVKLVRYHFPVPPQGTMLLDGRLFVGMCLASNHSTARARYCDRWGSKRFERLGDVYVMPPNLTLHVCSDETLPLTSLICYLDGRDLTGLYDVLSSKMSDRLLMANLDVRDASVRQVMLRLAGELRNPGVASMLLVDALTRQLWVELYRYSALFSDPERVDCLASWQLRLIDDRMKQLHKPPGLDELAALCHVSVRKLTRGFRACRGTSIGDYITAAMMDQARKLLAGNKRVSDIAALLGFSTSSSFCYAFRRIMGMTPGEYRLNLLRPQSSPTSQTALSH